MNRKGDGVVVGLEVVKSHWKKFGGARKMK